MSIRLKSKSLKFLFGTSTILICGFLAATFALSALQNLGALIFASPSRIGIDSAQENAFLDAVTVNTDTISSAQAVLLPVTTTPKKLAEANSTSWLSLAPQMSRVEYAKMCADRLGALPKIDCSKADELKIKVDDKEQANPVANCDDPVQLGINGQCTPGSRTGKFINGDVTTLFICRKYGNSFTSDNVNFKDVAVIQHNRITGDTCWFQSELTKNKNGSPVPSPVENSDAANQFWLEPAGVAGINCQQCHDADPFIWTPYIGQVFPLQNNLSPDGWNPNGAYNSNTFNIFGDQARPHVFKPTGNSCVTCHRIGEYTVNGGLAALDLVHRSIAKPADSNDKDQKHWMPPGGSPSQAAIDQLERCAANNPNETDVCNKQLPPAAASETCISGAVYVDSAYTGAQQGSATKPFKTVFTASRTACAGAAELHIKSGTYFEALTISKPLRLLAKNGTATLFGSGSTNVTVAPDTPTSITANDGNATVQIPANSSINTVSVGTLAIDVGGSNLPSGSAPRSPIYDVTASDQNNLPVTTLPGQIAIDISYADRGVTAAGIAAETDLNVYRRTHNGDGSYSAWAPLLPCPGCVQDTAANQFIVQTNQLGQFAVLEAVAEMHIGPPALNFTMVEGGANPASQALTIDKVGTGALEWSTIEVLSWLNLSLEAGNGPASIQISIDGGNLTAGIYAGTLYVVQGVREVGIPVTLIVQASNTVPIPSQVYLPLVVR